MPNLRRTPKAPLPRDEDEIIELPPLEGDDEPLGDEGADDLDDVRDDGASPYDDEEAGGFDEGVDVPEEAASAVDDDAPVEIGGDDELVADLAPAGDEGEGPEAGDEDLGVDDVGGTTADDRGEEGFEAPDELEDDLPPLDGESEGADDEEGELEAVDEMPWDEAAWAARSLVADEGATNAVAARGGVVMGGGERVVRLLPGSSRFERPSGVGGEVVAVAIGARNVACATRSGDVVLLDGDASRSVRLPSDARATHLAFASSATDDVLFARATNDVLFRIDDGLRVTSVETSPVAAIAAGERTLAALSIVEGAPRVLLSSDGGASWDTRVLASDASILVDEAAIAVSRGFVAVACGTGGLLFSARRGVPLVRVPGCEGARAVALSGSGATIEILAVVAPEPGSLWLVRVVDGRAKRIADLAGDEGEGSAHALAWDEARGVVWIAGDGGLAAFSPPPRH